MKQTLIVVALCSLFSCGVEANYSGRLHQETAGAGSPSTRSVSVSFDDVKQALHVDGIDTPIVIARENGGAVFNVAPGGDVFGGLGTITPTRLSFTVSLARRAWPYGLATLTFDGVRSEAPSESEPERVLPARPSTPNSAR